MVRENQSRPLESQDSSSLLNYETDRRVARKNNATRQQRTSVPHQGARTAGVNSQALFRIANKLRYYRVI
jgi:hypothetical protein